MASYSASDAPKSEGTLFNLATVQKMLPLIRHIVGEILTRQQSLLKLRPEQDRLERQKRQLTWPERQRRYGVQDEITLNENNLQDSNDELNTLGVILLDLEVGRVGFPTMVNNRPAFFSWRPDETAINSWHFAEETICRPIPSSWYQEISMAVK